MRFIDVKIRLPKAKLGDFLENLPQWSAQMIGYDILTVADSDEPEHVASNGQAAKKPKTWKAKPNPNYRPKHNTAPDMVLKILASKGPLGRAEILAAYKGDKFSEASIQSGIYGLRDHGLIRQNGDDRKFEVVSG
jgi:hypothetical protein